MKVILDIEADNFLKEVKNIWCIVVKEYHKNNWWVFDSEALVPEYYHSKPRFPLEDFNDFSKDIDTMIGHNLLGYDLLVLEKLLGVKFPVTKVEDTLVMSLMFNPDRRDKHGMHSLDAWGERLGKRKIKFNEFHEYSGEMLEYCVGDVEVNERLYDALLKEGKKQPPDALRVEHSVYYLMQKAAERGVEFDLERAQKLQAKLKQKAAILEREVYKVWSKAAKPYKTASKDRTYTPKYTKDGSLSKVGLNWLDGDLELAREILFPGAPCTPIVWEPFNLGSSKQVINKLNAVGWEPEDVTDAHEKMINDLDRGKNDIPQSYIDHMQTYGWKVNEKNLGTVSKNAPKPVRALAKWRMFSSRVNTLQQWMDAVSEETGRVHGEIFPIGTPTHRMRHRNPNLGNIPGADAPYGLECRRCFYIPEDDYVMVGTDAFKLELCCIANETKDPGLLGALSRREDMWAVLQELIDLPTKKVTKSTTYAYCYGAQNPRLGLVAFGGGAKEGAKVRDKIRKNIPNLQKSVDSANNQSRRFGKVQAIDGRWLHSRYHHSSFNLKMQGNGAIVCKRWLLKIMREVYREKLDVTLLLAVHDEYQFKVHKKDVDRFKEICESTIGEVGEELNMLLPLMSDVMVGRSWDQTH